MKPSRSIQLQELQNLASELGLSLVGVCGAEALEEDGKALRLWQACQYAGSMAYMQRDNIMLSTPRSLLPEAESVVSIALDCPAWPFPAWRKGLGKVARYAWGRDYHQVFPELLTRLLREVESVVGSGVKYRIISDAAPILERALARRAGLGFVGKNSMLITPGRGSLSLLGEIIWDLQVETAERMSEGSKSLNTAAADSRKNGCGKCQLCRAQCPTGAIVDDYVVDARKCISYLSIEKRGSLALHERKALGAWVFGCDECQEVCPFNHGAFVRERPAGLPDLMPEQGVGPYLDLGEVLDIRKNEHFLSRFSGTALLRARREGLLRNAAAVAANTAALELVGVLQRAFWDDASAVVRQHALWALVVLRRLEADTEITSMGELSAALKDPDAAVRDEACLLIESV